jgi:hypothetical protein
MSIPQDTPLDRAQAKLEQIERQLKKFPDFHLYLLTRSPMDRARMKRLLMEVPSFRLWRTLKCSVARAQRLCDDSAVVSPRADSGRFHA